MRFKSAGFTLIETLIVMVIMGFVMIAASGLASTVLRTSVVNQSRVQAIYLAQECTELVRNVRDSAWRQNLDWECPFKSRLSDDTPTVGSVFTIEAFRERTNIGDCQTQLGAKIRSITDPGSLDGVFKRYFMVDDYTPEGLTLTCHVAWEEGQVDLTQRLTNWRQP